MFIRKIKRFIRILNSVQIVESIEELRARGVKIGKNTDLYSTNIDYNHGHLVEIGDNVGISTNVTILAHDASTKKKIGYTKIAGVKIGNGSWVGSGCIILPGTTIGDNVIIGAGSVVRGTIPDNSVAIGNPAKVICSTSEYIEKNKKKLEEYPVFNKACNEMSDKEIDDMKKQIRGEMGFEP